MMKFISPRRGWFCPNLFLIIGLAFCSWPSTAQTPCAPSSTTMCLQNGRFQVTLTYNQNGVQAGKAVARTQESGFFWFLNNQNAEVLVKVLDATGENGNYWVYHTAMTHLAYNLTVTDLETGITKTYAKPANSYCGDGDTSTFTTSSAAKQELTAAESARILAEMAEDSGQIQMTAKAGMAAKTGSCSASNTALCLKNHRFKVEVDYVDPVNGQLKAGITHTYGDQSGFFSFFSASNLEIGVKVLEGQSTNDHYWVYIGGATHVSYTVKITDTLLGIQKSYASAGAYCGQADIDAFGNPKLRLQQDATVIEHNDNIYLGHTAFNQALTKTFTLYNDGAAELAISNLEWTGNDVTVVTPPPTTVAENGQGSFTLSFSGAISGNRSTQIKLTTTDQGPNPLTFDGNWTVSEPIGPVIQLKVGNQLIGQNQTVDFGNTGVGQPMSKTFTVENIGDQALNAGPVYIEDYVSDPSSFTLGAANLSNIDPTESGFFILDFDAAGLGSITRLVRIFQGGIETFRFNAKATVLPGDFNLTMGPANRTIDPGQNAFYTVTVNRLYAHDDIVSLSMNGLPQGASATFTPYNVTGNSSQLKITTTNDIEPGTYTFTVTGTSEGITRTTQATLTVEDPQDFEILVTPSVQTIINEASTTYSVSVSSIEGFNQPVALSLAGLPPGSTQSFNPVSVSPGQISNLTIGTSANTPPATYTLTIQGTHNGRVRTKDVSLKVKEDRGGDPTIDEDIDPTTLGGTESPMEFTGENLQGATVSIATDPAEPGDPLPGAYPEVSVLNISPDGTAMTVSVDSRNEQVSGFYTMKVTTPNGETGTVIRVVTPGPQIDAMTPSKPVRGKVYQLMIMGLNLRNATVTSGSPGIDVVVLGTAENHLQGYMFVKDDAPLGNTFIHVRNHGVTKQLAIEIVATISAGMNEQSLFEEHATRAATAGVVAPEVFLQDLTFDASLAVSRAVGASANKSFCFTSIRWSSFRYRSTALLPFNPQTGKIDRNILRELGLGIPVPTNVMVLSTFIDLIFKVQFECEPFTHIQVCIDGLVGAEIPGIGGLVLSAGGCLFGGIFTSVTTTTGSLNKFDFGTSNACANVSQSTTPLDGGDQRAVVTLDDCCEGQLTVSLEGKSFPEFPYQSWDFVGINVPVTDITPGGSCIDCGCENVPNIPAQFSTPLVHAPNQVPIPWPHTGTMRFFGTPEELANYLVLPEEIGNKPLPSALFTPENGVVYRGDGFLVNFGVTCATRWFKVPGGSSVSINPNGTNPTEFLGFYRSLFGGTPQWRDSSNAESFHMASTINPFADASCLLSNPYCPNGRATVQAENQITNPGFEDGTTAPFTLGAFQGNLSMETDPQHIRSGSFSIKHEPTGGPLTWSYTSPWNGSNQIDVVAAGEDTYRFSAWVKAAVPNTQIRMYLFAKDASGQTSPSYYEGQFFMVGTEWQELTLTHTMQPGYQYAAIRVDVRDPGVVWWDDLRFAPVDNLIDNPGFEFVTPGTHGTNDTPLFAGAQNGQVSMDATQARKGLGSLKLEASGNDCYTYYYHGANAAGLTKIETGEEAFRLTIWARADQDTPIELRLFGLAKDYTVVQHALADGTATSTWQKFTLTYTPSPDVDYISIRLDNDGGSGTVVWWDDVVFERLDGQ